MLKRGLVKRRSFVVLEAIYCAKVRGSESAIFRILSFFLVKTTMLNIDISKTV